eukprot:GFYU01008161.1.p1 GENE.GFYU01008161.1~~GFYU01008161.1.p1  ORF type:complete len:442 (+),score=188.44 GFYU01008161.1:63-1388(+)
MSSEYMFPRLKSVEILECLNDLGIGLTKDELMDPKPETVRLVYEKFVELLMGVRREDMRQPSFAAIDNLSYPELHDESIPELGVNRAICRLMNAAGLKDFALRSIDFPDKKSFATSLSAVINFTKFREDKLGRYQEFAEQQEELEEKREALSQKNEEVQSNLRAMQAQLKKEQPEVDALEAESQALVKELKSLHNLQNTIQEDVKGLKTNTAQVSDKIANDKFEIMTTKQDCEKMRSMIVQSPERLRKTISNLGDSLSHEKSAFAEAEKKQRELHSKLEALGKLEKDLTKATKGVDEVEVEMGKYKKLSKEAKGVQQAIENTASMIEELENKTQHLQRQVNSAEDKLGRTQKQRGMKEEAADVAVEAAMKQKEISDRDRQEVVNQTQANLQKASDIEQKTALLREGHESEVQGMWKLYEGLESQVKMYHQQLMEVMQNPVA